MPDQSTVRKAKEDLREGKSPTTAAGEFVHQEIEHVREGKHGARSPKQAIAIGLSEARRAGIPLQPPSAARPATPRATRRRKITKTDRIIRRPARSALRAARRASKPSRGNSSRRPLTPPCRGTPGARPASGKLRNSQAAPKRCPWRSRPIHVMNDASTNTTIAVSASAVP